MGFFLFLYIAEGTVDPLKSPMRPVTFTQMIDATPVKQVHHTDVELGTPYGTPEPPPTTTPMIKGRSISYRLESPQGSSSTPLNVSPLPQQPVTATPLIKMHHETHTTQCQRSASPVNPSPQLPLPPVVETPGLQRYSGAGQPDCVELHSESSQYSFVHDLPAAPEVTSVKILRPGTYGCFTVVQVHLAKFLF